MIRAAETQLLDTELGRALMTKRNVSYFVCLLLFFVLVFRGSINSGSHKPFGILGEV